MEGDLVASRPCLKAEARPGSTDAPAMVNESTGRLVRRELDWLEPTVSRQFTGQAAPTDSRIASPWDGRSSSVKPDSAPDDQRKSQHSPSPSRQHSIPQAG